MKKKILIGIGIVIVIFAANIGYIAWSPRNTAKTESEIVLSDFTNATDSFLWCENGYGKGITNDTPWWEQTYLGGGEFNEIANTVNNYLASRGYTIESTFIENSDDSYNQGKSYWEISGSKNEFTVLARVSSREITLNNCFGGQFPHKGIDVSPESYESVIVIKFRNPS